MIKPKILIFSGYGLNCEEETKFAFDTVGSMTDIVHLNDIIDGTKKIKNYQVLAFPGGFSYGDDTGSGKAYANKVRHHLWDDVQKHIYENKLIVGICNGFQILTNLGILPGALMWNDNARYIDRWVDLQFEGDSPWLKNINRLSLPIAHGEGKYFADSKTINELENNSRIAARYVNGDICEYQDLFKNPNGALRDIAGVLSHKGTVMGLMPHPERALFTSQRPDFPLIKEVSKRNGTKLPVYSDSLQIFKNAVAYFKN